MVFFAPDGDSPAAFNLSATGKFVSILPVSRAIIQEVGKKKCLNYQCQ